MLDELLGRLFLNCFFVFFCFVLFCFVLFFFNAGPMLIAVFITEMVILHKYVFIIIIIIIIIIINYHH